MISESHDGGQNAEKLRVRHWCTYARKLQVRVDPCLVQIQGFGALGPQPLKMVCTQSDRTYAIENVGPS
jgi:hypothetical protein